MPSKIVRCIYGGGVACENQGGTGTRHHAASYEHPIAPISPSEYTVSSDIAARPVTVSSFSDFFNDSFAKSILDTSVDTILDPRLLVSKSMVNFDLDTREGIGRLLELLPIMSDAIVAQIYQRIFTGYPRKELVIRIAKLEIRGYLMDYLADLD